MTCFVVIATALAIVPLVFIIGDVVAKGISVINLSFLTSLPGYSAAGVPTGGIANALFGSFIMIVIAFLISVPIGVGAGIFFSEWPESRLSTISSFTNDVLAGFPSIVIGIFVYIVIVLSTGTFSAIAGAVALSIVMIPIIARSTEESLKIVPVTLREASMALGVSRWRTVLRVVISTGKSGLATGVLLAVARALGETAPLLLTVQGSNLFPTSLFQPTAALPLLIFNYGMSGDPTLEAQAWGAAFILIIIMLALNLSTKFLLGRKFGGTRAEI
jgi:phosphate transport system permease protein